MRAATHTVRRRLPTINDTMSSPDEDPDTPPPGEPADGPWPGRLRALFDAALELTGIHERNAVLQRIVEGAATVASARYAALGVYDENGHLVTFVHHGIDNATIEAIGRYPAGHGLLGEVIVAEQPLRLDDLTADERSCGFPPGHPPMRTFLGVPIVRRGNRYGNLYVSEKLASGPFDDTDEALVVALAAFAAGAIETTELVESERRRVAAEEQARARRELLGRVIAAQESERARVSRDLHDDVGQALTSVLLGLRLVEDALNRPAPDPVDAGGRIAELRELVADALRRSRQLAFDLRPTVLDDIGLVPALSRLREAVADRSGIAVELDSSAIAPDERLAPEIETVIYRVVQEALTNVIRHAGASSASVIVAARDKQLRVLVEDDGAGFDPADPRTGHLGIEGMLERAQLVGGTLVVTSAPGEGTTVLLEVARA